MPIWDKLTIKTQEAIQKAKEIAQNENHQEILPEHLLLSLVEDSQGVISPLLERIGANPQMIKNDLTKTISQIPRVYGGNQVYISPILERVLQEAGKEAKKLKDEYLSTEHLLLGMVNEEKSPVSQILKNYGVTHQKILEALANIRGSQQVTDQNPEDKYQVLEKFTRDLTNLASQGKLDPVIGRDEEIRRIIQVLCRRTKNNPVLIGEPGVGKTAIVEGLAQRIITDDVPGSLKGRKLLALDMGSLVAGTKFRGEFEDRIKALLKEIRSRQGQIILFIDELHTVVGAGAAEGSVDASNMLKPALARGELRCIGATTLNEYRKYIEKDAALERRFQTVLVSEPSVEDTIAILRG